MRRASSTPLPASSPRLSPLRRWRIQSGCNADPFDRQPKILAISTTPAFLEATTSSCQSVCSPVIYTSVCTFWFENRLISVVFPNGWEQAGFGTLISAINKHSLVRLKIPFREECGFDSRRPHQPSRHGPFTPPHGGGIMPERGIAARTGRTPLPRNDNRMALSCWPPESRTGFGHRRKMTPRSVHMSLGRNAQRNVL